MILEIPVVFVPARGPPPLYQGSIQFDCSVSGAITKESLQIEMKPHSKHPRQKRVQYSMRSPYGALEFPFEIDNVQVGVQYISKCSRENGQIT